MVVQSGGPTAVINSSLVGLVTAIRKKVDIPIYGAKGGLQGLVHNTFVRLDSLSEQQLNKIKYTPGALLGTCRLKVGEQHLKHIIETLKALNVRYFFYIGGNGSMHVAHQISMYARKSNYDLYTIGIPKSIDNDLNLIDHSPGYASAAKFLISCTRDITFDINSYERPKKVTILETMGRNTGWLAAACSLAANSQSNCQQLIYIPEIAFHMEQCLESIERNNNNDCHTLLIVAEGIRDKNETLIASDNLLFDALDRPKLGGVSYILKQQIHQNLGISTRYIDTSIWQRCCTSCLSMIDVEEAYTLGIKAWEAVQKGNNNVMVTLIRQEGTTYIPIYGTVSLKKVVDIEKHFPIQWYDQTTNTIKEMFSSYLTPLLDGDVSPIQENFLETTVSL
ncbi:diphosphate--fructose-6-phosphate 1-phosphotransferase [Bacillus ndiopicus]|uniref:diphosphate--fructose-6-phosphate 1-phosphotransferase n=1 Tax=Bacillus ndiopicus TaxID=1347368 RepID=UPI00069418DF|nr:diphosphate--fructose-6-phosphate 1-phosphotransferase [Bacillus ndiopicus]